MPQGVPWADWASRWERGRGRVSSCSEEKSDSVELRQNQEIACVTRVCCSVRRGGGDVAFGLSGIRSVDLEGSSITVRMIALAMRI